MEEIYQDHEADKKLADIEAKLQAGDKDIHITSTLADKLAKRQSKRVKENHM